MRKIKYLLLLIPLFLVACFQPPTPNVAEVIESADPTTIIPLSNARTNTYYRTALPFISSPTRGLVYEHIRNRSDIWQVEASLMRLATDFFDPETYFLRDGQNLSREFVSSLLRYQNPEPEFLFESPRGLNPPIGTVLQFGDRSFEISAEIGDGERIRPFAYLLEQNFVAIEQNEEGDNEFVLEGVAIALALNPFYWERDFTRGFEDTHEMSEEYILEIGKDIATQLLPLLRQQEALAEVPILIGLFVLRPENSVLPGHFASITFVEEGRSSIREWRPVHERFFTLPDRTNTIHTLNVDINDQFISFRDTIDHHFPHSHGIVGTAHFVNNNLYRLEITVNMSFWGATEKIAFFQLLEEHVMIFSHEFDVSIIVRNIDTPLGAVNRPPGEEASVIKLSW